MRSHDRPDRSTSFQSLFFIAKEKSLMRGSQVGRRRETGRLHCARVSYLRWAKRRAIITAHFQWRRGRRWQRSFIKNLGWMSKARVWQPRQTGRVGPIGSVLRRRGHRAGLLRIWAAGDDTGLPECVIDLPRFAAKPFAEGSVSVGL